MKLRSGTALVVGLAAILGLGWFSYRAFVPPRWLHDFAGDIAYRATPDPNAPAPRDAREARPPANPEHPYICFAKLAPFPWDRMVVVPSGADPREAPGLKGIAWPVAADHAVRMKADPRYQLIVLLHGEKVVADAFFFTFWADLTNLARPDGFTPETAVFTAAVEKGTHVLTPVDHLPEPCGGPA
jgi:hypothetical protein